MEESAFIDFYEILEISPNANIDTIDRVFRYLAQRYHPDHPVTGDPLKFSDIVKAHEALRFPEKRAHYDLLHKKYVENEAKLVKEARDPQNVEYDAFIQEKLLSILYMKRRRNMQEPGIGNLELERLTSCPREHLEFHLWYLKEKNWINRLENGLLAITVSGVDKIVTKTEIHRTPETILLTNQ